jgi:hypothetical protein
LAATWKGPLCRLRYFPALVLADCSSLGGSTLRADNKANGKFYGRQLDAKEIVLKGEVNSPPAAEKLLVTLNKKTSKETATSATGESFKTS